MRPRIAIIISFFAIAVLLLVQAYSITQTFRTKKEQFDARYINLVKEAIMGYERTSGLSYLDTVMAELDQMSLDYLFELDRLSTRDDTLDFRESIIFTFTNKLNKQINIDEYIREYLAASEAATELESAFRIINLTLLEWEDRYPILEDSLHIPPLRFNDALLANSYTVEGNYFRLRFDYYVDFPQRKRILYREMTLTLLIAVITILVVLIIFYLTTKNMLIQKKLSDMKSDFINNMTHELKTPLSTIAVATTTLGDEKMMENRKRVVEISRIINKQNKHLTQLIDRILDISIWEKDQVKLKKKQVHIWEFMKEKIEAFRIEQAARQVVINEEYQMEKDYIALDEIHLTTVINNLLSNAVKYSSKTPLINVRVSLNDRLVITVSDNGIGISKEDQKHIFDKFYRVGKGDFKTVKGLGLGLYYVRQIVQAHGGEITLTSNPGKGSTFTIIIPRNNDHFTR